MIDIKIAVFFLAVALVIVLTHDWFVCQDLNRLRQRYYMVNQSFKQFTNSLMKDNPVE